MILKGLSTALILIGLLITVTISESSDQTDSQRSDHLANQAGLSPLTAPINAAYTARAIPAAMTISEKKNRFTYLLAPAVETVFKELTAQHAAVRQAIDTNNQDSNLAQLHEQYQTTSDEDLLHALKPHPRSIAMAQAAMESAWGTSRFFQEANNVFGIWSFDENEPRLAASIQRSGTTVWVRKYESIEDSVRDYYRILASGRAFRDFRSLRAVTSDPYQLVAKLDRYSERGAQYGAELAAMIRFNKLDRFDH